MTRYKITAYVIDFVGVLLIALYAVGHRMSSDEVSFWSTTNTVPFLYLGIALVVIGMAMILHDVKRGMNAPANQQAEDKS